MKALLFSRYLVTIMQLQCRLMSGPIGTTPKVGFGQNISYVGFPKIVSNGNALSSDRGIFLANCDDL